MELLDFLPLLLYVNCEQMLPRPPLPRAHGPRLDASEPFLPRQRCTHPPVGFDEVAKWKDYESYDSDDYGRKIDEHIAKNERAPRMDDHNVQRPPAMV